ncbi:nucleotide exchange factor GrpE [Actinoplanes sp. N902-109]|uniref:nucleotide exchange factor GrpE n=1 Tax=Actinoplanes sp. (strain N902-109) TaxID=649831 RepID=UPI0003293E4C|nr:nucleotide exchange factor GrpE [Actinoplanes sp. N902-109]AGL13612.1 GrpE protein HSP-70 cofactor [Actinoplanes sp. N902-109]
MSRADDENDGQATERVVIRDRRKIDKVDVKGDTVTDEADEALDAKQPEEPKESKVGAHRAADESEEGSTPAPAPGLGAELEALRGELEDRTRDLQRVTAEYANYRKRVDRDRSAAAEQTTAAVLTSLLPVLDDIDRAREHGDLNGPFATVAEALSAVTGKLGLVAFGEKGDPFDPTRHEAVAHLTSPDVTETACVEVMRRGYTLGERLLRPAMVAVADPE